MAKEGEPGGPARETRYLTVGIVRKPHGIRGELAVRLESDKPEHVFVPGRRLHVANADGRPGARELTVERARPFKNGILLKVEEHGGRDESLNALRGCELLVEQEEVAPLEEGEVFSHELVGTRVAAGEQEIGVVVDVIDVPAGQLLEVQRPDGTEVLIPLIAEVVKRLDTATGRVEIEPPAGLLEL
ncbi:ribosome maturation factor RimM [soil metagenome]